MNIKQLLSLTFWHFWTKKSIPQFIFAQKIASDEKFDINVRIFIVFEICNK